MIPVEYGEDLQHDYEVIQYPSRTYRLNFEGKPSTGMLDGREAIKQTIYMILYAERYQFEIFSWNYGIELKQCYEIGETGLLMAKLESVIREALLQDDRITSVENFTFDKNGEKVRITFLVRTTVGDIESECEFLGDSLEVSAA